MPTGNNSLALRPSRGNPYYRGKGKKRSLGESICRDTLHGKTMLERNPVSKEPKSNNGSYLENTIALLMRRDSWFPHTPCAQSTS